MHHVFLLPEELVERLVFLKACSRYQVGKKKENLKDYTLV